MSFNIQIQEKHALLQDRDALITDLRATILDLEQAIETDEKEHNLKVVDLEESLKLEQEKLQVCETYIYIYIHTHWNSP